MRWSRKAPGRYAAGPYTVERHEDFAGNCWRAFGPGLPGESYSLKATAQEVVEKAARERIEGQGGTIDPVPGDAVVFDDKRGHVSARLPSATGETIFVIQLPRGRRACRLREEFEVVVP